MADSPEVEPDLEALAERLRSGDETALAEAFDRWNTLLRTTVRARMDPRLSGRVDVEDVMQEAWVAARERLGHFEVRNDAPPFLWVRAVALQTVVDVHRRHLGTASRTAAREAERALGAYGRDSASLSHHLAASITSPSQAAMRAELSEQLLDALDEMAPIDREVLALRHFDELTNDEVAAALGLSRTAASNRYIRALQRLRKLVPEPDGGTP